MAEDNAGVYFYGTPPSTAQIAAFATGADVTTATRGNVTAIIVKWPDVSVMITNDPEWNRAVQLSGIRGWFGELPATEQKSKPVVAFLADLDRTTACYGSVISPGYDKAGKAATLLKKLLGSTGGFFFSHQTFYSASGTRIAGMPGDPATLGPK